MAQRIVLAGALMLAACVPVPSPASAMLTTPEHDAEIAAWRTEREASLRSPTGYLAITELAWLEDGVNAVGSAANAVVNLPAGRTPAHVGVVTKSGPAVSFTPADGVFVTLEDGTAVSDTIEMPSDATGAPTRVFVDDVAFWVIDRAGRIGVRVRDAQSELIAGFEGVTHFPVNGAWKLPARFAAYDAPRELDVPNVLGTTYTQTSHGELLFEHEGAQIGLVTSGTPDVGLFVIFGDATNGEGTYGGGRFLAVDAPDGDGNTTIDFNRAYNPPCALSPHTTCPMPPEGNTLAFEVTAGETLEAH